MRQAAEHPQRAPHQDLTMKPIIGINGNVGQSDYEASTLSVRSTYVDAVLKAGGTPVMLPPIPDREAMLAQVEACAGFIFIGGPDIDPARYGEKPHPTISRLPERRESYDFALIEEAIRQRKPFLAICLGCQQVNVALGGSLIQDIYSDVDTQVQHTIKQAPYLLRHDVKVEAGSMLGDLLGVDGLSTNSAHHQAIKQPGKGLRVVARCAADGIVEACELENYPYGLAIQWHPEYLVAEPLHLKLFEGLVRAATAESLAAQR
ncbi:MAG: gamma-glutamyl-gamma-aminobutyrate hydrolase family protein [Candidatus Sumerlaeaceae bacterium]|nr:gamma-glutamyl-gamma-aminobutyrate hydrolase family protein [Candidatus Sumerlaeaceae bacterium]